MLQIAIVGGVLRCPRDDDKDWLRQGSHDSENSVEEYGRYTTVERRGCLPIYILLRCGLKVGRMKRLLLEDRLDYDVPAGLFDAL